MAKEIFKVVADNEALFDELKALFVEKFEASFTFKDLTPEISDQVLGQFLRMKVMGLHKVEEAFQEIAQHKTTPPSVDKPNPAF